MPLTQDEAAQQMSEDLQEWLQRIGPACETFQPYMRSPEANMFGINLDFCIRRLRGPEQ
jgi:hypothetical protein